VAWNSYSLKNPKQRINILTMTSVFKFNKQNNFFIPASLFIWIITIPFKNAVYQVAIAFLLISCVFIIIKNKDYSTFKSVITRDKVLLSGITLLFISMTVSNYFGLNPSEAFIEQLKFFYKYIFIFFALLYLHEKKYYSLKLLIIFILISLSIQALNGVYQHVVTTDFFTARTLAGAAITGSFPNQNVFGLFMIISSALFLVQIQTKHSPSRLTPIMLMLFIISIYGLLFSYSRASWVAFSTFYLIMLISTKKMTHFLVLVIPLILALILFLSNVGLMNRLEQLLIGHDSGRFEIWLWAINSFKESWLLGYGLDSWHLIKNVPPVQFIHNSILDVAVHLGVLGVFSYTLLSLHILRKSFLCHGTGAFALGVALFVISLFDHSVLRGKLFLPILTVYAIYVIIAAHHREKY